MKNFNQKIKETQPVSIENLGKLFQKRLDSKQYVKILKDYFNNIDQHCVTQRKQLKSSMTTSRIVEPRNSCKLSKINTNRQNYILNRNFRRSNFSPKQLSIDKTNLGSSSGNFRLLKSEDKQTSNIKKISKRTKASIIINEGRFFTSYSKKGRLLAPNKHSIIAQGNIFIICEGQGQKGKEISTFISQFLYKSTQYLFSLEEFRKFSTQNLSKLNKYFKEMFDSANYQLTLTDIGAQKSGCTITIVVIQGSHVTVCSLGDSNTIVLGKCEVKSLIHFNQFNQTQNNNILSGVCKPAKCCIKNSKQQVLNQSRCFGYIWGQNNRCQPQISMFNLSNYEYLIVGSSSLFQYVKNSEISKFLYQNIDKKQSTIARQIVELTCKRMRTISHQDISCIIVNLKKMIVPI